MIRAIAMELGMRGSKTLLIPKRAGPTLHGVTTIPAGRIGFHEVDFGSFLDMNDPDVVLVESTNWSDTKEGVARYLQTGRSAVMGGPVTTWGAALKGFRSEGQHSLNERLRAVVLVDQLSYLCSACSCPEDARKIRRFNLRWDDVLREGEQLLLPYRWQTPSHCRWRSNRANRTRRRTRSVLWSCR